MDNQLLISTANKEVLQSGSVMQYENDSEITFCFKHEAPPFFIHVKFNSDEKDPQKLSINFETTSDNLTLTMTLTNYNNPLGAGNVSPMQLGKINERPLFLNYVVVGLGNNDIVRRIFHYTWYLGQEGAC